MKYMNLSEIKLPSNRKFGFFFSSVFFFAGLYLYILDIAIAAYALISLCVLFIIVTLLNADLLLPFNKMWMRFGLLLGKIVSPIVLGFIFFGIFTPISLAFRLFGRDELRLQFKQKTSHWIPRVSPDTKKDVFKRQF